MITLYSSKASQWASVPLLALAEKGYMSDDYVVEEIDLVAGDNFNPDYIKINPNATVPTLTASSLSQPLIESADILVYLDQSHSERPSLFPKDPTDRARVDQLIQHVHQSKLTTDLILLRARDEQEFNGKKASIWKQFIANRQEKLEKYGAAHPEIPLYSAQTKTNRALYDLYTTDVSLAHEYFFRATDESYKEFAAGLQELDSLLVLPYAAGKGVTAADFHVVPWLAHALWGAGGHAVTEFEPLEKLVQKSVPAFTFGVKTKTWWKNVSSTDSFREVFPVLH